MTIDAAAMPLFMLTITLVVHLVATVWWAASLTKRVDHIEKWISSNEHTAERLAAMEQQIENMIGGITRIERHLRSGG
ncbi:MAG: hypothetical protein KAI61_07455 [Alphaproteobacteria bacterium]|nr:hypothetical protein [Alphaproteobacteria bacterium]MCK5519234.1 hypothetical protein [Alphaproteobacteria bacterium]MCK5659284.1 hypothetical protein [Alphaproteobacteria bacterium]